MLPARRSTELRLLLPLVVLVPLGFAVTHIAQTGTADPGLQVSLFRNNCTHASSICILHGT